MKNWKQTAINHFNHEHLSKEQNRNAGMWPNKEGQIVRFKALMEIGDLNGKKIIDVGCGLADFYYFLIENSITTINYTGLELHPEIVKLAKEKHPEINILNMDILENHFETDEFDYSFASGLFNFRLDDWFLRTETILKELFRISKTGVSANFLRWREDNLNPASYYTKPVEIMEMIGKITNNFVIKGNYKVNDFTVFIFKNQLV